MYRKVGDHFRLWLKTPGPRTRVDDQWSFDVLDEKYEIVGRADCLRTHTGIEVVVTRQGEFQSFTLDITNKEIGEGVADRKSIEFTERIFRRNKCPMSL